MNEGRLFCGSQIVVPFSGASFLIVIIPNKFSDKYWCPHRTCSFGAQSLCSCKSLPGNTGPLGKTPSFTDASPSVFLFYLPPTPPPTPSCNVTFFLSFPSQFLTLYQDWAGGLEGVELIKKDRQRQIKDEHEFWGQTWFEFLSLPVADCAMLEKSLRFSEPQFSHL